MWPPREPSGPACPARAGCALRPEPGRGAGPRSPSAARRGGPESARGRPPWPRTLRKGPSRREAPSQHSHPEGPQCGPGRSLFRRPVRVRTSRVPGETERSAGRRGPGCRQRGCARRSSSLPRGPQPAPAASGRRRCGARAPLAGGRSGGCGRSVPGTDVRSRAPCVWLVSDRGYPCGWNTYGGLTRLFT